MVSTKSISSALGDGGPSKPSETYEFEQSLTAHLQRQPRQHGETSQHDLGSRFAKVCCLGLACSGCLVYISYIRVSPACPLFPCWKTIVYLQNQPFLQHHVKPGTQLHGNISNMIQHRLGSSLQWSCKRPPGSRA